MSPPHPSHRRIRVIVTASTASVPLIRARKAGSPRRDSDGDRPCPCGAQTPAAEFRPATRISDSDHLLRNKPPGQQTRIVTLDSYLPIWIVPRMRCGPPGEAAGERPSSLASTSGDADTSSTAVSSPRVAPRHRDPGAESRPARPPAAMSISDRTPTRTRTRSKPLGCVGDGGDSDVSIADFWRSPMGGTQARRLAATLVSDGDSEPSC